MNAGCPRRVRTALKIDCTLGDVTRRRIQQLRRYGLDGHTMTGGPKSYYVYLDPYFI